MKWLLWVIAVGVVIALAVLLKGLLEGASVKGNYVYLNDGKYYLLKDIAKDPLQFATLRDSDQFQSMVHFSADGKYIYYFSNVDSETSTGTLCRAQISKIKSNDSSNACEILDTNVPYESLNLKFLSNGDVVYVDEDDNLKLYHDGQSTLITRDVKHFYELSDDESGLVYHQKEDSDAFGTTSIYGVKLADPENPIKLSGNVLMLVSAEDPNNIYYVTFEKDSAKQTLYATDLSGNTEKIADNVGYCFVADGKLIYSAKNGSKISPYDYVNDSLATQDASATEPQLDNYKVPYYRYTSLDVDADPNDYTELYTSCTHGLERFSSGWDSMDDVVKDSFDTYAAATKTAVQSFIDKYESQQDEDGYLLVTDEIRNDLKSINATMAATQDSEWISLCFSKEQAGTTTDYDTYNEDLEAYHQIESRNALRETLQSADTQISVYDLYMYNSTDKSHTILLHNILAGENCGFSILGYYMVDQVASKIPLEDITSTDISDASDAAEMITTLVPGTVALFDRESGKTVTTIDSENFNAATDIHVCGDTLLVLNENSELLSAPISDGTPGSFNILAENALALLAPDSETLYYYGDTYSDSNDDSFGDFYCYSKGENALIARDVQVRNVSVYEDGNALAFTETGTNENNLKINELNFINEKGEFTYVADGVTQAFYLTKNKILYVSDGDLYLFNGKERERLAEDIDFLWYNGEVQSPQNQLT